MITCMIIDDEPLAVDLLKDYVEKTPFLKLVSVSTEPLRALDELLEHPVDLLFLDIQMPEITGLQFMKLSGGKSRVIFTTAYSDFALEGYEHNAIDYLLKPVTFERFYTAALKARGIFSSPGPQVLPQQQVPVAADYIFVKTDRRIIKVFLGDILFAEGLKDYIAIHTRTETLIVLDNLKDLHSGLPDAYFVRVHKSYLVAMDKIDTIERTRIFIGDKVIPIGDSYREHFLSLLKGRQFGGR